MTLTNTGPLLALIDKGDPYHERCVKALSHIPKGGMLTTLPCLVEVTYFLRQRTGWNSIAILWQYMEQGVLQLHYSAPIEFQRMRELMTLYRDIPCDLADASLIATAETLQLQQIFTLDRHFHAYRLKNGDSFLVVP